MAETTMPVYETTKRRILRFRAAFEKRLGRNLPMAEAIALLVQLAEDTSRIPVTALSEPWDPPPNAWFEDVLSDLPDPGIDTDSSKVDDDLYGEGAGENA